MDDDVSNLRMLQRYFQLLQHHLMGARYSKSLAPLRYVELIYELAMMMKRKKEWMVLSV